MIIILSASQILQNTLQIRQLGTRQSIRQTTGWLDANSMKTRNNTLVAKVGSRLLPTLLGASNYHNYVKDNVPHDVG